MLVEHTFASKNILHRTRKLVPGFVFEGENEIIIYLRIHYPFDNEGRCGFLAMNDLLPGLIELRVGVRSGVNRGGVWRGKKK